MFVPFFSQFFDTNSQLSTILYYSNFVIIYALHIDSSILTDPGYEVYISQLIRYVRTCSLYSDVYQRYRILSTRLLKKGLFFTKSYHLIFQQVFRGRYQ